MVQLLFVAIGPHVFVCAPAVVLRRYSSSFFEVLQRARLCAKGAGYVWRCGYVDVVDFRDDYGC